MNWMSLSQPLELNLPKYIWRGNKSILIKPSDNLGVNINWTSVTPDTLNAVKHWTTARFLEIEGWNGKISVVEHLLSALKAAWLTHVDIEVEAWFIPVIWPWIQPAFWDLELAEKDDRWIVDCKIINSKQEFEYWGAKMIIEPSDTFDLHIDTNHPDLTDIWAKALLVIDVNSSITDHLIARPIARLQNPWIKWAHSLLSRNLIYPLNGIWGDSYIMTKPSDKGDDIVERMHPQYQEGRNEHLFHTMTADFLWELSIFFPGDFKWKITLLNTNHTSRVALLRQLYNYGEQ